MMRRLLKALGLEVRRRRPPCHAGSEHRPVGDAHSFLEDLKARGFIPRTIVDVGANEGGWSRMAKTVFPNAACHLIEPQREMKPALEAFCREFDDSRFFLAGAGAEAGELRFSVYEDLVGSSFLSGGPAGSERTVPVITIDSLFADGEIPPPVLAKLDVQGFELEALKGAAESLEKIEVVILEVSFFAFQSGWPLFHEVIAFMHSRGFVAYDFAGFLRRPRDGALGQADVCFVREEGVLRQSSDWSK